VRRLAAETIGKVQPGDDAVFDALNAARNDADNGVREAVTQALAKLKNPKSK
jgi:hypothetical protein